LPGVRLAWPTQANEVFPILPHAMESALRQAGVAFHPWTDASLAPGEAVAEGESLIRLVVSFATQEAQVDRLVEIAASAAARHAAE
jgi:threonine aldolase